MTDITTYTSQIECRAQRTQHTNGITTLLTGFMSKIREKLAQRRQRRIDRDAFKNLMLLDEASLKDIGITKDDIIWASNLAMNENASKELEKIRANNIATARTRAMGSVQRRKN